MLSGVLFLPTANWLHKLIIKCRCFNCWATVFFRADIKKKTAGQQSKRWHLMRSQFVVGRTPLNINTENQPRSSLKRNIHVTSGIYLLQLKDHYGDECKVSVHIAGN